MFDLRLEDWRAVGQERWTEDEMSRDQIELARDFMRRDSESWNEMNRREAAAMRVHPNIWDRPLTAREIAELEADLEEYRQRQLLAGMHFEEVEEWRADSPANQGEQMKGSQ